jgi:putative FmdB family regulatory protein
MPTYEYRCAKCGQHVEVVQSFADGPLTECGVCGGALRKVFGSVGIVFKGSGFYKTDNRGGAKTAARESKSEPKGEPGKETKESTAKPAETKSDSSSGSKGTEAKTA